MTGTEVLDVAHEAFWTLMVVAGPPLVVALVIGLGIGLFQALTQIQEATLTFVPKMIALGAVLLLMLPVMGASLAALMDMIVDRIITG